MVIYSVKKLLEQKGVTPYRLFKDGVLNTRTWENFRKGGDLSMKSLSGLCDYLNCNIEDLVKVVSTDSFEGTIYRARKLVEEKKVDSQLLEQVSKVAHSKAYLVLETLVDTYKDSLEKDTVIHDINSVLDIVELQHEYDEQIKKTDDTSYKMRFDIFHRLESIFVKFVLEILNPIRAKGSLARLETLNNNFSFAEYLKKANMDFYGLSSLELVTKPTETEFKELVERLKKLFDHDVYECLELINSKYA